MKKNLLLLSMTIFFRSFLFAQDFLAKEHIRWIPFKWNDSSTKDVMLVYTRCDTLHYNLNWQLDTGSPYTFLNGMTWNVFYKKFPFLKERTKRIDSATMGNYYKVANPGFVVNNEKFLPDTILKNDKTGVDFPADYLDKYSGYGVGTIGLDVFKDKVLLLDFTNNKIGCTDSLTNSFYAAKLQTTAFKFYKNRIILPVTIGNRALPFMYDCGASMFTLQTTPKNSAAFAPPVYTDTLFNINNGETGETHNVAGGKVNKPIKILGTTHRGLIVYVEKANQKFLMKQRLPALLATSSFSVIR